MKRAIPLLLLAALTFDVQPQALPTSYIVTFVPPTEYVDGTPLNEADIDHYSVYCDGSYIKDVPNDFSRQFTLGLDDRLAPGSHTCGLSDTVAGIESVLSNTKDFPLGQRTPGAPTLTTVVPGA